MQSKIDKMYQELLIDDNSTCDKLIGKNNANRSKTNQHPSERSTERIVHKNHDVCFVGTHHLDDILVQIVSTCIDFLVSHRS